MSGYAAAGQAAAQLIGSYMQAEGAKEAAGIQGDATRAGIDENQRQYETTRADTAAWRDTGRAAVNRLGQMLGLGRGRSLDAIKKELRASGAFMMPEPGEHIDYEGKLVTDPRQLPSVLDEGRIASEAQRIYDLENAPGEGQLTRKFTVDDFWNDPVTKLGYDSALAEGRKGLRNVASATGMRNSGNTLKALTRYASDYTGGKANESYNRFYADQDRIFNRLSGVSGTGQTSTINTAALGQQNANTVSGLLAAQGNARGAASIAGANAWGNAVNNIGNNYQQQATLDKYLNSRNTGYNQNATYGGQNTSQDDFSYGYY